MTTPQSHQLIVTLLVQHWHVKDLVVEPGRLLQVTDGQYNMVNSAHFHIQIIPLFLLNII